MRFRSGRQFVLLIIVHTLLLCIPSINAQSFRFKTYDSNVGLPQNFVYSLCQDHNGYIWMGTGEGLVKYNGLEFTGFNHTDSLADDFISVMAVARDGSLWIGHNNGDITIHNNNEFFPLHIAETKSPITAILADGDDHVWAVSQNEGVININRKDKSYRVLQHKKLKRKLFYSLAKSNNQLLAGTSEGLIIITPAGTDSVSNVTRISQIPMTNVNCIVPRKGISGDFWVGTEDSGFYLYSHTTGESTHVVDNSLCLKFDLQWENIRDIEEEPNGNLLLATWGSGVIKLFFDPKTQEFVDSYNFTTENGLSNNYVRNILCDREANYWFATYGGGTSVLSGEQNVFYNLETIGFESSKAHSSLLVDSTLWIGLEDGLIKTDPFCFSDFEYYDQELGLPNDKVTGLYHRPDKTLFVATAESGLYFRKPGSLAFSPWHFSNEVPAKKIRDIEGIDDMIYLATYGGFFIINTNNKQVEHLTTGRGLPHNNINFVEADQNRQIWIGPRNSGICRIVNNQIEIHKISDSPVDVFDLTQTSDSSFWLATHGQGIIKYSADSIEHYNITNGLAKNFCYSIEADSKDRLWIAHHPGLSMFDTRTGEVETYGHEDEMGADFFHISKDFNETLWFSSANGAIHYFPQKDVKNDIPPALNFTEILISGKHYFSNDNIDLPYPYRQNYKFRFNFIGISFKNPKEVTYEYQLQSASNKSETEWIDLGNTSFREYDFLPSGNYNLKVRAFNADGFASDPISVSFSIATPFWKKPWFYLILGALIIYSVYLIIVYRERKLKKQKELLQKEVDLQTIQLREQKAEIERKNRDITDSINYAKTIQSSILPPLEVLKSRFPDSFVFFVPRDIVSGDFYWFYKTKTHFLVTCADCTGHGVPGAFMSMIGSTLLNDIVKRKDVNSPADLLERLDFEIKVLLQNSKNKDNTRDGMDISVVEFESTGTRIRVASAKRPVILYINGELTTYKGNRRSIGDSLIDDDTPFMNIEYNASEGDLIYLFSDGYTDQFGGPREKKFMKVGVKNMLEEIHSLPMDQQYQAVKDYFSKWKGDLEQVDDVIFMGIQL
jgi:ligand-binding sensor domain-containing protein/serine phosphatase RsbU (regulator of sigma subunit)